MITYARTLAAFPEPLTTISGVPAWHLMQARLEKKGGMENRLK
jgi:hypothetical protein